MKSLAILFLLLAHAAHAQLPGPITLQVLLNGKPLPKHHLISEKDVITFRLLGPAAYEYCFGQIDVSQEPCTNAPNMPLSQRQEDGKTVVPTSEAERIARKEVYSSGFDRPAYMYVFNGNREIEAVEIWVRSIHVREKATKKIATADFEGNGRYRFVPKKNCRVISSGNGTGKEIKQPR